MYLVFLGLILEKWRYIPFSPRPSKNSFIITKTALKHVWPLFFQGYHTFSLYMGSTDPKNHSGPLPLIWYRFGKFEGLAHGL